MELCTARAISNLPQLHSYGITVSSSCNNQLRWRPLLPSKSTLISFPKHGFLSLKYSSPRYVTADESPSSVTSQYVENETDGTIASKGRVPSEEEENNQSTPSESPRDEAVNVITMGDTSQPEDKEYGEANKDEVTYEDVSADVQKRIADVLDQLNLKFDSEDSYSVALFGITVVVALWLATAVVGAIDSIPVVPKLLEVVGIGYTVWFSTRYLIFKRNRDELAAKIEELKEQVLGSNDE